MRLEPVWRWRHWRLREVGADGTGPAKLVISVGLPRRVLVAEICWPGEKLVGNSDQLEGKTVKQGRIHCDRTRRGARRPLARIPPRSCQVWTALPSQGTKGLEQEVPSEQEQDSGQQEQRGAAW